MIKGITYTDKGEFRSVNQDRVIFLSVDTKPEFVVGAVCDGIGSFQYSELASSCVSDGIKAWYDRIANWIVDSMCDVDLLVAHLKDGVEAWNESVCELSMERNIKLGTTLSMFVIYGKHLLLVQIGDSKIYHWKQGIWTLQGKEDKVYRIVCGMKRGYLSNYFGRNSELKYQLYRKEYASGDRILYGSDGFFNLLAPKEYERLAKCSANEGKEYVQEVITQLRRRGETDNISVGLLL